MIHRQGKKRPTASPRLRGASLALIASLLLPATTPAGEWSGYIALEDRLFQHEALDGRQHGNNLSLAFQPEYHHEWDHGRQGFAFSGFLRGDQHDPQRSHGDIRELAWFQAADTWELHLGVRKVFWGVTESRHLVDIINQTDLVEAPDGEEKLGQPMAQLILVRDWGNLELFWLPRFRERRFPGVNGRLRGQPPVDPDRTTYASSHGRNHQDWALRWSHYFGDWDIGLSHFSGTSRDPLLVSTTNPSGDAIYAAHYDTIDQTSLDLQATKGDWLWKLEAAYRNGQAGGGYSAAVGGFEYTLVGVADTAMDLGLLAEYLWDDRGSQAGHALEDDIMLGLRLTMNDAESSEALIGIIQDLDSSAHSFSLEASRRLGDSWKLSLEGRIYSNLGPADPLTGMRNDDYLQMELAWYF
jgi:hypothetical protein